MKPRRGNLIPARFAQFYRVIYDKLYGPIRRGRLEEWPSTLPDPVLGAATTLASSSGNHKAKETCDPCAAVALYVDTKSTGRSFQVMAQSAVDKIPPGPKLDALTAEKVFGWKNVRQHETRETCDNLPGINESLVVVL